LAPTVDTATLCERRNPDQQTASTRNLTVERRRVQQARRCRSRRRRRTVIRVDSRRIRISTGWARVWIGGNGPAIVLLHGGWGSARTHWAAVWESLSQRAVVLAPEFPVIGDGSEGRPRGLSGFSDWLVEVMNACGVATACVVGNSFGGAVAWELAVRAPQTCDRLVLVSGGRLPLSAVTRRVLGLKPFKRRVVAAMQRRAAAPGILESAFADPHKASPEIRAGMGNENLVPFLVDALLGPQSRGTPRTPALIVWGGARPAERRPGKRAAKGPAEPSRREVGARSQRRTHAADRTARALRAGHPRVHAVGTALRRRESSAARSSKIGGPASCMMLGR
jgi:pimeloyl-ACP methyl ester carboxylesterase